MRRWTRSTFHAVLATAAALLLPVAPAAIAAAAPDLAGVWQGKLPVDAKTSLTVQFTFTKGSNGAYTAVLNSPDNPALKDTVVNGVSWDGTNLKLQVPSLSGAFAGALKAGSIGGQWTQPGSTLPLSLAPYQKPVLTAAAAKSIAGSWNGVLEVGPVKQNLMFQFKQGTDGALTGTFSLPDQGVNDIAASSVAFEVGELSLKVQVGPQLLDYKGKLAGDVISGTLKAAGLPADGVAVNLKRGEYKVVAPPLKLSTESFAALKGKWQGAMEVPMPPQTQNPAAPKSVMVTVTARFETNAKGEYIGYLAVTDPPPAKAPDTPGFVIAEAQMVDGKLALKVPTAANIEFSGVVSGKTITGTWTQAVLGRNIPLVLTRQ
ncbi:MAG: hypothetical protein WDO12_09655 [Pseudomonadota bacterium]